MTDSMRDKIVDIIFEAELSAYGDDLSHDAASEIITALPDMVVPLVWESDEGSHEAESVAGTYRIEVGQSFIGWTHNDEDARNGKHADTLRIAKAAAQAHYVAQIMAAFACTIPSSWGEAK